MHTGTAAISVSKKFGGYEPVLFHAFTATVTQWEHDWVKADTTYRREKPADPLAAARALLDRIGAPA